MTTSRRLVLPLVLACLTMSLAQGRERAIQTESGAAPKVRITTPVNNVIRYGLGLTFIAGTVEGTNVKEVNISIRRVGTNEEWSPSKKGGQFVKAAKGASRKWLKTTLDGNNWFAPNSKYSLPTLSDLLPAGTDEMRYIIYATAKDSKGHTSEEEGVMIIVRR